MILEKHIVKQVCPACSENVDVGADVCKCGFEMSQYDMKATYRFGYEAQVPGMIEKVKNVALVAQLFNGYWLVGPIATDEKGWDEA